MIALQSFDIDEGIFLVLFFPENKDGALVLQLFLQQSKLDVIVAFHIEDYIEWILEFCWLQLVDHFDKNPTS